MCDIYNAEYLVCNQPTGWFRFRPTVAEIIVEGFVLCAGCATFLSPRAVVVFIFHERGGEQKAKDTFPWSGRLFSPSCRR